MNDTVVSAPERESNGIAEYTATERGLLEERFGDPSMNATAEKAAPAIEGEVIDSALQGPSAQQVHLPVTNQQTQQVLTMLERVLTAPEFDIDRAERLWAMQKEIRAEQARAEFIDALSQMQSKTPPIKRAGKILNNAGQVQSTFAKWEHINEAVGPVLRDHGFALSFRVSQDGNKIKVDCVLSHRAGHQETTDVELAPDASGSKNAPQAVVSAISYGKRVTASALLNITSYDEDDDGQTFGDPAKTDEHMAKVADFEAAIVQAIDEVELRKVGNDVANSKLPPRLQTRVRKLYTARLRELRASDKAGAQ